MNKVLPWHICFLLTLYLFLQGCSASELPSPELNQNQAIGTPIVKAIDAYFQDKARYPTTLEELVPGYLEILPKTSLGEDFFFDPKDSYYYLCFNESKDNLGCCYLSEQEVWDCSKGVL